MLRNGCHAGAPRIRDSAILTENESNPLLNACVCSTAALMLTFEILNLMSGRESKLIPAEAFPTTTKGHLGAVDVPTTCRFQSSHMDLSNFTSYIES